MCKPINIYISYEMYQFFDDWFEARGVFLDISWAFDKDWQNGVIYKLKQHGVAVDLLNNLKIFLKK